MLKNMRLVILFDIILNPSFKMTTSFVNIARTTLAQVNWYAIICIKFQIIRI